MIFSACGDFNKTYTQYKVLVDNSVSMNEFLEKYEIINIDGKIYTIQEINGRE